jgi:hypothetical protein
MRQGNILVGADPVDLSIAFPELLLLDPATGNLLATLSDLYLDEYSNLVNDNETGRVYHVIKSGTLFVRLSPLRVVCVLCVCCVCVVCVCVLNVS